MKANQALPTEESNDKVEFDPEVFQKSMLEELDKRTNGYLKELKKEFAKFTGGGKKDPPAQEAEANEQPNPNLPAEVNAALQKMKSLQSKLEESEKRAAAAEAKSLEKDRQSAIREAMSGIAFRDKASSDFFFNAINGNIVRDEDGELVANTPNGPLPIKDYVGGVAETLPGLIAPKGMGGTGATPGGKGKKGGIDLNEIKPGMDRALLAEAMKQAQDLNRPRE